MKRRLHNLAAPLRGADPALLGAVGVLLFIGLFVVWGAGSYGRYAGTSLLGQHYVAAKHLFMIAAGTAMALVLMNLDYRVLRAQRVHVPLLVVSYALVAWTLLGERDINRWITIFGFSLQPVELAKLALIIFLAERLARRRHQDAPDLHRVALAVGLGAVPLVILLVLQPNFGNVLVVACVTLVLLFVSGKSWRWLGPLVAVPAVGMTFAFLLVDKLQNRWDGWLDGLLRGDYAYQVTQSIIGLGAGGWRGLGVGQSHNKFAFLPEAHTDFAFSVLGEEWGLFGTLTVIAMLGLIGWRGFAIAARAADPFGSALAAGVTTGLTVYGVANIGMVTGILPVIGVPLPFVSFGGTAMIGSLAAIGLLLSVERVALSREMLRARWDRSGTS